MKAEILSAVCFVALGATLCHGASTVHKYSTYNAKAIRPFSIPKTNSFDLLINDDMLCNNVYNRKQYDRFMSTFTGNIMSDKEKAHIYDTAKKYHLNIIALVTKIQLESGVIEWGCPRNALYQYRMSWCMGAGMYETIRSNGVLYKPNAGYYKQVDLGAKTLRKHFNAWTKGSNVRINEGMYYVYPRNAATYALYKYTPYFGTWIENGVKCGGQEVYVKRYKQYVERWNKTNKDFL